jgi:hypothetical protein
MTRLLLVALSLLPALPGGAALAQEREPPKDSARVSIPGCAKGPRFIVTEVPSHEDTGGVAPGRRFRLSGPKDVLRQIKAREGSMIVLTGLVRKAQLAGPGGVAIAGGRIRIGGAMPRQGLGTVTGDTGYNEAVIDVEAFQPLAEPCPKGR